MRMTRIGDLEVSALGLGCMGLTWAYGTVDEDRAVATLRRALERGITLFDTSDVYGPESNERLVGTVLAEHRDDVVLATKAGLFRFPDEREAEADRPVDGRPAHVRRACDASLQRLGVDVIDLYYLHRVDPQVPVEETVGAMAELVVAGKVRQLGLSEAAPATLRRAHAVHPIAALQSEYSLWTRDPETEALATCRELGTTLVAYSPLGRGFLTGAFRSVDDLAPDDWRRNHPRFQGDNFTRNLELADGVRALASGLGATPAQVALAWVLAQGDDVVPIPGTTRPERVDENVAALDVELDDDTLASLSALFPPGAAAGARYPEASMAFVSG